MSEEPEIKPIKIVQDKEVTPYDDITPIEYDDIEVDDKTIEEMWD